MSGGPQDGTACMIGNAAWDFQCPHCHTHLTNRDAVPTTTNCPICGSKIPLDLSGRPTLKRIGPPSTPKGSKAAAGAVLGGVLGAVLGGGPGAILGALIGGAVGTANETSDE